MKTNSKVMCIDDARQRTDVNDAPDGLVEAGRLYTIAGVTAIGGLIIVGHRSISKSSGRETGFRANRFATMQYYRAEFSQEMIRKAPAKLAMCHRPAAVKT